MTIFCLLLKTTTKLDESTREQGQEKKRPLAKGHDGPSGGDNDFRQTKPQGSEISVDSITGTSSAPEPQLVVNRNGESNDVKKNCLFLY